MSASALDIFQDARFPMLVTTTSNGAMIFRASDLAKHLSVRDGVTLVQHLPEDEKMQVSPYTLECTPSGQGEWFLTESGFYRAITQRQVGRIRNPQTRAAVEQFQNWVFRDALPALRKAHEHGIDAIGELKQRVLFLEDELETERMTTDSEHLRNRQHFLDGVKAGRANPDIAYGLSKNFRMWEQGD